MMDATTRAAIFKQAAQEQLSSEPTVEMTFGGLPFTVRRVDREAWTLSGRLPQALTAKVIKLVSAGKAEVTTADMSAEDAEHFLRFQRDLVMAAVVAPKLVIEDRALAEDEISYQWLVENFKDAVLDIFEHQMLGAPGVPVRTTKGEVPLSAVEGFRDQDEGASAVGSGSGVP